jgi:hypothetical protein
MTHAGPAAVNDVSLILDVDALLQFASGSETIGSLIAQAADHSQAVLIPAASLSVAYRRVGSTDFRMLDILANLSHVMVSPLNQELCLFVGGWARKLGLELAHAAVEAVSYPDALLVTSRRALVTRHLPKEWPIYDV